MVLLPAADDASAPPDPQTLQPRKVTPATILVVEDADELREITALILTKNGYQVITAANGPEALEVVKTHGGKIDLLLTDVVMPIMQGQELVDRIAASHP